MCSLLAAALTVFLMAILVAVGFSGPRIPGRHRVRSRGSQQIDNERHVRKLALWCASMSKRQE
jgi:hypothetical protein